MDIGSPRDFFTSAVHAGHMPDEVTGAVSPPLYSSVNYAQEDIGVPPAGYVYSRTSNPTRDRLQECLAALDGGKAAVTYATGMAASDAAIRLACRPGDHVLLGLDAFSGTHRLLKSIFQDWDIDSSTANMSDVQAVRSGIRPNTRVIWVESPTNPLLQIADLETIADIAQKSGALLIVDNTLASPYLQQPLALGADIVVYSNKYISGHSDCMVGGLVTNNPDIAGKAAHIQNAAGAIASPWDCWLTLRGAKTLPLRMDRHCDNAEKIVEMLCRHPRVSAVYYPGLPNFKGHELARRQMRRFGGIISFTVEGSSDDIRKMCARAQIFTLAESLGGIESLVQLPALMTHNVNDHPPVELPHNLIRISVGLEDPGELMTDLSDALQ